jgi:outer membrane protein insertion porin family
MKLFVKFVLLVSALAARADDLSNESPVDFTVTGIRVEGLQRISEGTVFNTLPINIGDRLSVQRVREALRALNDTGFFRDVELRREEPGVLVVVVLERASIRTFDVKGNKILKTEDLMKSLRNVGLASGKILNRSTLEDIRQYLIEQYFARGNYDVLVDANVDEQPNNLVDVHVNIVEGKRARIRQINVVGNERFSDRELLAGLELKSSNLLSFYKGSDRYSRQVLEGDLEKLRSYYMDRGYADFEITSTQVSLAPEKDDLFITVNVYEGTTWKMGAIKLAGRFVVPEEVLKQYLFVKPGDRYSQRPPPPPAPAPPPPPPPPATGWPKPASDSRTWPACRSRTPPPAKLRSRSRSNRTRAPMSGASTSRASNARATKSCAASCVSSKARCCRTRR